MALWNHPDAARAVKETHSANEKRLLNEIVVDSKPDSSTHRLILHWAGGVHTELCVERNKSANIGGVRTVL